MSDSSASLPPQLAPTSARSTTVVKLAMIAILVLLGLIPLALLRGVVSERRQRHHEAIDNITSTWGQNQVVAGPVLVVPYRHQVKVWKEQIINNRTERIETTETVLAHAWFLPAELKIEGDLAPDRLHRGIYEAIVYRATLALSGRFTRPSFAVWNVPPEDVQWQDAFVAVGVSDLRGTRDALSLKWGEQAFPLEPGARLASLGSGVHARLSPDALAADPIPFSLELDLHGSGNLSFAPFGTQNQVSLRSPWPDPSFNGAFLPTTRTVSADGFTATWQLSYYGRNYPAQGPGLEGPDALPPAAVASSLFGLNLMAGVDSYRLAERSVKYGILFLTLVFTAFFLWEVLSPLRVHPFQYTLIGCALCLFYLGLLSLSEFIGFGWAYLTAAAGATLMISLYSVRVLASGRRAGLAAAGLAAVYAYLFVILRQQEYSLLYGSAGLFLVLALVMYATRKIDWYARDRGSNADAA